MIPAGREFYKMSGSGNDFVFVDARTQPAGRLNDIEIIQSICARGTGVGADGIVFLEPSAAASIRLRYLNSDGSVAALCGNATLCTARLFVELGGATPDDSFTIETAAGVLEAVVHAGTGPEIEMPAVAHLTPTVPIRLGPGERRAGFVQVGIPHLVVLCDDIDAVDIVGRGRPLRFDPAFAAGTNVNFVGRGPDERWYMRTYERGVEGETLACGTGAVATAVILNHWDLAPKGGEMVTRSGKVLRIGVRSEGGVITPRLAGEARIVYRGSLAEI
ncbi:MAG: diaminopimelate epimerase [Gemmatimonadaceae bacterium]